MSTKLAAMQCNPIQYLASFAEKEELLEGDIAQAEEYLVQLWTGARSKPSAKTFDQLCLEVHLNASTPVAMSNMPPTSSVVQGHITRAFYVIQMVVTSESSLNYCQYR